MGGGGWEGSLKGRGREGGAEGSGVRWEGGEGGEA